MFSAEDGQPFKKRSRGGKRDRQSNKDRQEAYKFKGKLARPLRKYLSKKEVLQLIREVLQTNVGPPPAPPESEDEERELPLTSNHHQWLEQVQDALEEKFMADPSAQASSSTVAAASSSTAPDDAASADSSSDLEVAMEPDESAGPETTIRCTLLSGELSSRFVASSEILGSSAASRVTVSLQPPTEPTVIGNIGRVQRTMTREQLNNSYGLGLQLIEAIGWREGSGLGTSRAATAGALKNPLKSDTQLDRLSAKKHFSLDTYVQDNPIVDGTKSGALVAEPVTQWDVRPHPCGKCSEAKWPAYRQPGHYNKSGDWLPTTWVCSDCAQATPNCMNCTLPTWNGFNVANQESGRWLCAKCWTDGDAEKHHKWGPWFRCREIHYPQVISVMPHDVRPSIELHSYEWIADQAREGNSTKWFDVKEYSIGKKAWGRMVWQGEIPSEDKCSAKVNKNFLRKFLRSRPYQNKRCDELFDPVEDKGEGWLYYGMKLHSVKKGLLEKRLQAGWLLGFHGSRMECVHSIVCNGLKDGHQMKQKCRGVYHLDRLMRGSFYHRYQLFDDGTAYCIVWYILVDPEKTFRIPETGQKTRSLEKKKDGDQWVTEESGVIILGSYIRGYTMSQIRQFCKNPAQSGISTLVSQWQPKLEADVGRRRRLDAAEASKPAKRRKATANNL